MPNDNVEQIELFLKDIGKEYGEILKFMINYSASDGANEYIKKEANIKFEENEFIILEGKDIPSNSYRKFSYDDSDIKFLFNDENGSICITSTLNSQGLHAKNTKIIIKILSK